MIRVLVNGAKGKMGTEAVKAIDQHPNLELVGALGRNDDLASEIKKNNAQVVVDFTNADAVLTSTRIIIESGARPVIGSTGLSLAEIKTFQKLCNEKKLGGIIAPNFSLGAVLLMKYSRDIAAYYQHVEIIEKHHEKKLDAPSGTALRTAELIAQTRKKFPRPSSREKIIGSRGALHEDIPIHALRMPGTVAELEVVFGGLGETLTLHHNAIDRLSFMPGVCLSCEKVMMLDHLVYGLEDIL